MLYRLLSGTALPSRSPPNLSSPPAIGPSGRNSPVIAQSPSPSVPVQFRWEFLPDMDGIVFAEFMAIT